VPSGTHCGTLSLPVEPCRSQAALGSCQQPAPNLGPASATPFQPLADLAMRPSSCAAAAALGAVVALALTATVAGRAASFVVEKGSVRIVQPARIAGAFDSAIGDVSAAPAGAGGGASWARLPLLPASWQRQPQFTSPLRELFCQSAQAHARLPCAFSTPCRCCRHRRCRCRCRCHHCQARAATAPRTLQFYCPCHFATLCSLECLCTVAPCLVLSSTSQTTLWAAKSLGSRCPQLAPCPQSCW
jgi:hypothetical protein